MEMQHPELGTAVFPELGKRGQGYKVGKKKIKGELRAHNSGFSVPAAYAFMESASGGWKLPSTWEATNGCVCKGHIQILKQSSTTIVPTVLGIRII